MPPVSKVPVLISFSPSPISSPSPHLLSSHPSPYPILSSYPPISSPFFSDNPSNSPLDPAYRQIEHQTSLLSIFEVTVIRKLSEAMSQEVVKIIGSRGGTLLGYDLLRTETPNLTEMGIFSADKIVLDRILGDLIFLEKSAREITNTLNSVFQELCKTFPLALFLPPRLELICQEVSSLPLLSFLG
jgi:hypothetical protein